MTVENLNESLVHYGWVVLAAAVATVFAAIGLGRFGYTMILPEMRQGLGLGYTAMGTLATGNFIGYLLFAVLGGYLASRFGTRVVIAVSLLVTGATMALTGVASGFLMALIARTVTGMGSAGANVPVMGLLSSWFGRRRRGMASGIAVAGGGIGMVTTGWLVPWILARAPEAGWRISWYVLGGIAIVVGVAAWFLLRDTPSRVGLEPIGFEDATSISQAGSGPPPEIAAGALYTSPILLHLGLIYAAFGVSYAIYVTFFAAYLTEEQGVLAAQAGNLWSLVGILAIFCGFVWGSLSDKFGRGLGLALVYALMGVGILMLAVWPTATGYTFSAFLFGATALGVPTIMAATCGDFAGPRFAPAALGAITLFFGIGQSVGPGVGGWLADQRGSFAAAFVVAAGIAFVGAAGAAALRRHAI